MARFQLLVNGKRFRIDVAPDTPLLWVLRDTLNLTGTKYGCGVGVCGACSVLAGDQVLRSCQVRMAETKGRSFTTIEGISPSGEHPCQRAWIEEDVAQCGYCQAGMILNAVALLKRQRHPTEAQIDEAMADNICRCGTYQRVRRAIRRAAAEGAS